jgi:hypothetical protein
VDLVAAVGAYEQSAAVVQPGEGPFDDPAVAAESRSVSALPACDHRHNTQLCNQAPVLVVVVAAVGEQPLGSPPRSSDFAANGWHPLEQVEQLGDVVAVRAAQRPGKRDAAGVYEEMVLAACPAAVDRARPCLGAPFFACR